MILASLLHYLSAVITIILGSLGGGIAQGIAGLNSISAMQRQPMSNDDASRAMIVGLALIESGVIIALVTTLVMLVGAHGVSVLGVSFAELGIALAVGCAAISISIASSQVVRACTHAISRQPLFASKIFTFMLLTQSIIEAPIIFAFIVGLIIRSSTTPDLTIANGLRLLSAGLVLAIGCIGPAIGQAIFARAACTSIGLNKNAYSKIFPFTLISEAVIETPVIFCLLFSFIILFTNFPGGDANLTMPCVMLFASVFCICLGALGAAIAIGRISAVSCLQIANNEAAYGTILRTNLLTIAFIESTLIYSLITSLLLVTKIPGTL
ncbi:MAG: ATP synthase F0, C subunit [candidate division TM6 bacterium GW2011_GWF2_37_49]|nr:MAG: ATP synthase F0, C subunit [candidate division TM6 bacterium GW2011_GWF2_37_49]